MIKAEDILSATRHWCGNMEAKMYVYVETKHGNYILSPKEYREIPGRPRARLIEGSV